MHAGGGGNVLGGDDDFTYTEDSSGVPTKVAVEREFVFKVVVLGDYSVGKTCLIKRMLAVRSLTPSSSPGFEDSDFDDSGDDDEDTIGAVTPTVGTDFYSLSLPQVLPAASIRLQLWDTAGLPKYAAKYENTFRNASFVICVFDVTSASSLHDVVDRHLSIAAEHLPGLAQSSIMVVANKIDILRDVEQNTSALHDARRRAQSPETAFAAGADDDTAANTEVFTSVTDVEGDAMVTAKKVQAEVFDLFSEVHYAEVSAKTGKNVQSMLKRVAFALLRNSAERSAGVDIPEMEPASDVLARTVLPLQSAGSSLNRTSPTGAPHHIDPTVPVAKSSSLRTLARNPPSVRSVSDAPMDGKHPSQPSPPSAASTTAAAAAAPSKLAPSWSAAGGFKFDMAPPQLASTALFSPVEGTEEQHMQSNGSPRSSLKSLDIPSANAATAVAVPSVTESRISAVRGGDALTDATVMRSAAPRAPGRNESPQARKEREQAEIQALLGRAGQRKEGQARGGASAMNSAATVTTAALQNDADKMEDDAAMGRDQVNNHQPRRPVPSILDSLGMQDDEKNAGSRADDDDDDGAQMQARLKDRFAQIDRDIRQDNAVTKKRAKKAAKAKGKCKCVLM